MATSMHTPLASMRIGTSPAEGKLLFPLPTPVRCQKMRFTYAPRQNVFAARLSCDGLRVRRGPLSSLTKKAALFSGKQLQVSRRSRIVAMAQDVTAAGADGLPMEEETGRGAKIAMLFGLWWTLNVVFNIYNKKVLNAYPTPWLTSTLSLAAGALIMLVSWATRLVEPPQTDSEFWKTLFPVALMHTIGHVAATVSMSKVAVSFTHIIKSSEPAFSVVVQSLMGESFVPAVYLSLLPVVGGCGLAAMTELNFNMGGFAGAMISNLAFVFRNIFSKKGMSTGKKMGGLNYYACLSIMSLFILTPFALWQEGPAVWAQGWDVAKATVGDRIIWWMLAQSVFYHLYNQVSYAALDNITPLTFSIGNTMKRVSVIVSSIIIFKTPVRPINAVGAAIAILGTYLYARAQEANKKVKKAV